MRSGNVLDIQLTDSNGEYLAVPDVLIDVVFFVGEQERYRFNAGQTDARGFVSASYDHFESIRKDNQTFALMDYNTPLEDCSSRIVVRVPTIMELRERVEALNVWFPEDARAMAKRLQESNNDKVDVRERGLRISDDGRTCVTLLGSAGRRY